MTSMSKEQMIEIVRKLQNCAYKTEAETDKAIEELKKAVIDHKITDYIFFDNLTPEEIVDKAISYKPIIL